MYIKNYIFNYINTQVDISVGDISIHKYVLLHKTHKKIFQLIWQLNAFLKNLVQLCVLETD